MSSIHRTLLALASPALVAGLVVACDSNSPVQPLSPDSVLFSVDNSGSGISTTAVSASEIDLAWQASPSKIDGFQVFRSTSGPAGTYSFIAATASTVTGYADRGLTASTTYCYQVRSFRNNGRNTTYSAFSATSCTITLTPPVNAPSGVNVVPTPRIYYINPVNSAVGISWEDNSDNEGGFRIERASVVAGPWAESATAAANATSLYVNAAREQQVCFRVIAVSTAGESMPSPADCTTPPGNPTSLVAKVLNVQSITLTWSDNSAAEDGYKVARLDGSGTWTDIAILPSNAVSYSDIGASADITYTYRVRAMKDGGFSEYSNEAVAVIATSPPPAPADATAWYWVAWDYGWFYLDVSWTDASSNERGFRIEYSADGVTGWHAHSTLDANTTFSEYKFDLLAGPGPQSGCYRVIAFNDAGDSNPSNVTCAEWGAVATDLTATPVDQQTIDLKWTDNAHFEFGYAVFRSTTMDGAYELIGETAPNQESYRDTGLTSGQQYWYFVATDLGGYSIYDGLDYSDFASATTPSTTESAMVAAHSSVTLPNNHTNSIRIRGRPSLEEIRAAHGKASVRPAPTSHAPRRRLK